MSRQHGAADDGLLFRLLTFIWAVAFGSGSALLDTCWMCGRGLASKRASVLWFSSKLLTIYHVQKWLCLIQHFSIHSVDTTWVGVMIGGLGYMVGSELEVKMDISDVGLS